MRLRLRSRSRFRARRRWLCRRGRCARNEDRPCARGLAGEPLFQPVDRAATALALVESSRTQNYGVREPQQLPSHDESDRRSDEQLEEAETALRAHARASTR